MDWKTYILDCSHRITGNHWDAEDLAQDATIKVIEALRSKPDRALSKAFLYRIVKHAWIDRLRARKIASAPLERDSETATSDPLLLSRELLEQLSERLPPKMAVIVLLADVFDFTAKETAALFRMKEGAVQVSLGRARRKLSALARDPEACERLGEPDKSRDTAVDLDALVDAFQRRDPYAILRSYTGLVQAGIRLAGLNTEDGRMHFTFRDPDGNSYRIISRKIF
jgi:RNA polymerase sigma factor (sigma-70 family)